MSRPAIQPIGRSEREQRARTVFGHLADDQYVRYYTGFVFAPTERPIAAIITREGERMLFVPRLEREHAEQTADADRVVSYPEYPGRRHPMCFLQDELQSVGAGAGPVGVDHGR